MVALNLSCWKRTLVVGNKTAPSGPYASVPVLEQNNLDLNRPGLGNCGGTPVSRTLALSPSAFCFEDVFLGCFWMKISLPGISFLTSGVWQEEGAAASQSRSPGQSHSCTTRGLMGPEWRTAWPQIVKQRGKNTKKEKEKKTKIQAKTTNQTRNS